MSLRLPDKFSAFPSNVFLSIGCQPHNNFTETRQRLHSILRPTIISYVSRDQHESDPDINRYATRLALTYEDSKSSGRAAGSLGIRFISRPRAAKLSREGASIYQLRQIPESGVVNEHEIGARERRVATKT